MFKAALLAILGFAILGTYLAMGTQRNLLGATDRLADHQHEVLARTAALTGFQRAKQVLATNFVSAEIDGTYEGRTYAVDIAVTGGTADVESVGTSVNHEGDEITFTVRAQIEQVTQPGGGEVVPTSVPAFLEYALLTEEDLDIRGTVDTYVDDAGGTGAQLNADVHTNDDLSTSGNAFRIRGFGSYVGTESARDNNFIPNYNPDGAPSLSQTAPVDIPTFDADTFLSRETADQSSSGNVTLSGNIVGGTREDPLVWHIQGNVTASGGVTITGYVMFIVEGNISISGNLVAGETGYEGNESNIALYSAGDVTLHGNVQIHGQIYAEGDIFFTGTPDIYGSVTTHGRADIRGTPAIHYRAASPYLSTIFEETEGGAEEEVLRLLSYSEF